jgi:serine/threonine protein kinase
LRRKNQSESVTEAVENEVAVMKELDHQGIIKILDFSDDAEYTLPNGRSMEVYYIAIELASNGEIFDVLAETGRFSEPLARHYFHQLVESIEHMHSKGVFHRDIKPENIMLDSNFDLKVADFGFSSHDTTCSIRKGTTSYMAPEMHLQDKFKTAPLDIFAAGLILFIMLKAAPAFNEARLTDTHYKLLISKPALFWKVHFKKFGNEQPSEEIKELITKMLEFDPEQRITLENIKNCDWYNGPVPSKEDIIAELTLRKIQMSEDQEMEG